VEGGLRTIATFGDKLALELARARLAAAGIRCFVPDEHTSTLNPHYMAAAKGLSLKVRASDAEAALAVLSEPADEVGDDEDDDGDDEEAHDGPRCPHCGARYAYFEWPPVLLFVSVFLLGLPLLFCRKSWHCRKCDRTFGAPPPVAVPGGPYRAPRARACKQGDPSR
jgi:hypothetical protein